MAKNFNGQGNSAKNARIQALLRNQMMKNQELEKLLHAHKEKNTMDTLKPFVERLRDSMVQILAKPSGENQVQYLVMKDSKGNTVLPLYTSPEEAQKAMKARPDLKQGTVLIMKPFSQVNAEWLKNDGAPIVLNPYGDNVTLTAMLLKKIGEAEEERKKTGEKKPVELPAPMKLPELHNEALEKDIEAFAAEKDAKKRTQMIENLMKDLSAAQLLLPNKQTAEGKIMPELLVSKDGKEQFLRVLTTPAAINREVNEEGRVTIMNWTKVLDLLGQTGPEVTGVAITTAKATMRMPKAALNRNTAAAEPDAAAIEQAKKLAGPQYEHMKFEADYLPTQLFTRGEEVVHDILNRRAQALDELFEASYTDKREYPYLEEEFTVMPLSIGGGTEAIQIDFPERDQGIGTVSTAVILWSEETKKARYFATYRDSDGVRKVMEVLPDGDSRELGAAPTEGMELRFVLDAAELN